LATPITSPLQSSLSTIKANGHSSSIEEQAGVEVVACIADFRVSVVDRGQEGFDQRANPGVIITFPGKRRNGISSFII
jgi:hypothetical protein